MTYAVRTASNIASQSRAVMRTHLSQDLEQTLSLLPASGNQHVAKIRNTLGPIIAASSSVTPSSSSSSSAQADSPITAPVTRADPGANPFRW
jgi:hypothetical protein